MKRILLYCISAICLLCSCFDDNSGIRNTQIGSITIDGIEDEYNVVSFRDILSINPTITSDDPTYEFEYLWTIYIISVPKSGEDYPVDTIGRSEKLDYVIENNPGSYKLILRVTSLNNDYTVYKMATVNVNTMFTTGHYFLKETADGNTELDFLSPDGIAVTNLLQTQTNEPIIGKPTRLGFFPIYSYKTEEMEDFVKCSALLPMGGKNVKIMQVTDMTQIYDHTNMFYGDEPDEIPLMAYSDFFTRPHYVSNKGHYLAAQQPGWGNNGTGMFGLPSEPEGGNANLSPNNVVDNVRSPSMYNFFDENSNRLFYVNYNGEVQTLSSTEIDLDSLYQTPRDMIFMGTNGWAVLWDEADHSSRHLYQLNLKSGRDPVTETHKIDPTFNFCKGQVYGSNKLEDDKMLYAGIGGKLYMYNTESHTEKDVTPAEIASDETITMITHKPDAPKDYLMIGTFKNGEYKVYMYVLTAGEPYGKPALVVGGLGKVVDMQYVSPTLSGRYVCNY